MRGTDDPCRVRGITETIGWYGCTEAGVGISNNVERVAPSRSVDQRTRGCCKTRNRVEPSLL